MHNVHDVCVCVCVCLCVCVSVFSHPHTIKVQPDDFLLQMNLGGAKDRPLPSDIWKEVQGKL